MPVWSTAGNLSVNPLSPHHILEEKNEKVHIDETTVLEAGSRSQRRSCPFFSGAGA
jgi:hypothetical protein